MPTEVKREVRLKIAHVLFIDVVGYSKLLVDEQRIVVDELNGVIRQTDEYREAESAGHLIKIPTGDGMALVFYSSPESPVECALEISRGLKEHPKLRVRMGVHSGPVSGVIDVNERANVAGAGINFAQRVMDCGDDGHILLSKRVSEDLEQYGHWRPHLHDLSECEVKHGVRLSLVNLYTEELGNPAQSDTIVRFPADDPSKTETFRAGVSVRGIALDSKGNLWSASNMSLDFPPPVIPDGVSIMEQFQIAAAHMIKTLATNPKMTTGIVNMIRPDGSQPEPKGFTGNNQLNVPWGVSIDGNDDVWVGNFWARGVMLMAGDHTKGHPAGTKAGDGIHNFQSGSIQMITDVAIDAAGNVWAANNWNAVEPVVSENPIRSTSTWGGGSGITVIYGVAAPVKPPLLGQVRTY